MRTYDTAHEAAKQVHKDLGADEPFEYWGHPEKYIGMGLIHRRKNRRGHFEYIPITSDMWYLFSSDGVQEQGPFESKKEVLRYVGEDSASYVDTGIYSLSDDRYVARRAVAIEREFDVDPPAEVTNG